MIEICSCYGYDCGSRSQSSSSSRSRLNIIPHLRDRDRESDSDTHHHNNPHHHQHHQHHPHNNINNHHSKTMMHSSCFSSQFPVRSSRSFNFKGACLLTAALAFCVGIGIGILIPLYFLPVSVDSLSFKIDNNNNNSDSARNFDHQLEHLTLTPQPVISNDYLTVESTLKKSSASELRNSERTLNSNNNNNNVNIKYHNTKNILSNLKTDDDDTDESSSLTAINQDDKDSVSNRFPEFAQIQALGQEQNKETLGNSDSYSSNNNNNNNNNYNSYTTSNNNNNNNVQKSKSKQAEARVHPMYRRPSSNVKFVVPDSRILSLHPVQPEIPPVRFNDTVNPIISSSSASSSAIHDNSENFLDDEHQQQQHGKQQSLTSSLNLLDGIYWSEDVEKNLPKGFTDEEIRSWRRFVKRGVVTKIEEGCGRMQNRLLSMENGTRACCRYRHNFDQIQGEIFSFYLSQILNIRNLAPSALNIIQPMDRKWSNVRQQLNLAQWVDEKPVVLTRFIDNLQQAFIPSPFRDSTRRLHPIDLILSSNLVESMDVNELAQWSDLIVFDYLTANLDRMVNNLYNLQWNPSMMEAPAHNLAKDASTGLLVFLDNESGLLHGYRLLDKYEQYHRVMLDSLCVFRKSTAEAVKRLHRDKNVGNLLKTMFQTLEPNLVNYLPIIPDKSIKILNHRIDRVYHQITNCESLYMS